MGLFVGNPPGWGANWRRPAWRGRLTLHRAAFRPATDERRRHSTRPHAHHQQHSARSAWLLLPAPTRPNRFRFPPLLAGRAEQPGAELHPGHPAAAQRAARGGRQLCRQATPLRGPAAGLPWGRGAPACVLRGISRCPPARGRLPCAAAACGRPSLTARLVRCTPCCAAAVVELCSCHDQLGLTVAAHCAKELAGDSAVPAAVILHSLLTQLWRKQVRPAKRAATNPGRCWRRGRPAPCTAMPTRTARHQTQRPAEPPGTAPPRRTACAPPWPS